jgi:LMBR1 domain-containing protein 1
MAFMAFIGWFLFVLFGGVGLSALPLDMINEFIGRPKLISSKDAAFKKTSLKKQTVDLLEKGSKIKGNLIQ